MFAQIRNVALSVTRAEKFHWKLSYETVITRLTKNYTLNWLGVFFEIGELRKGVQKNHDSTNKPSD